MRSTFLGICVLRFVAKKSDGKCIAIKTISMIESCYPNLTKTEKLLADYILQDTVNTISSMTMQELAGKLGLGEATIVRFCRKIGFKGFLEFKFTLALDYAQSEEAYVADNYLDAIENNMVSVIHESRTMLDLTALNRAIDILSATDRLFFYGAGSSGLVAGMAEERFMRIGKLSKSVRESHMQFVQSSICKKGDVVVAISVSGSTIDLYGAVEIAKKNGATIITITNHIHSPMAQLSECVLLTCGQENPIDGGTLVSMASQMYVVDALCTGFAIKNHKASLVAKERVARSMNTMLQRL